MVKAKQSQFAEVMGNINREGSCQLTNEISSDERNKSMTKKESSGKTSDKVKVAVSPAMVNFRKAQTRLNHFFWTSEISSGYVLSREAVEFRDSTLSVLNAFQHVHSSAWYPNTQGREKLQTTVGQFFTQVRQNSAQLYRLVITGYYTWFEEYLDQRIPELRVGPRWGPFLIPLAHPCFASGPAALPIQTVLLGDFCREIRNLVVHEPDVALPVCISDARINAWRDRLRWHAKKTTWRVSDRDFHNSIQQLFGQVENHLKQLPEEWKDLPPEYFYMLFIFTNLDQLACQVEEALIPKNERQPTWIRRSARKVRRPDLIIPE